MKELDRTTRLIIAATAILLVFVIGYSTMKKPVVEYKISIKEAVKIAGDPSHMVSPVDLKQWLDQKDNRYVLVDIRNRDEYFKGHISNALNIPSRQLLDPENIKKFREMKQKKSDIILYGNELLDASSSCLLLNQLGISNAKVLMGGYNYWNNPPADSLFRGQAAGYLPETVRINKSLLLKQSSPAVSAPTPVKRREAVKIKPRETTKGGGC